MNDVLAYLVLSKNIERKCIVLLLIHPVSPYMLSQYHLCFIYEVFQNFPSNLHVYTSKYWAETYRSFSTGSI